jgi:hypothetical protein
MKLNEVNVRKLTVTIFCDGMNKWSYTLRQPQNECLCEDISNYFVFRMGVFVHYIPEHLYGQVKVKLSLCLIKHHTMKTHV